MWEYKGSRRDRPILVEKRQRVLTLFDFKNYYISSVIYVVWQKAKEFSGIS